MWLFRSDDLPWIVHLCAVIGSLCGIFWGEVYYHLLSSLSLITLSISQIHLTVKIENKLFWCKQYIKYIVNGKEQTGMSNTLNDDNRLWKAILLNKNRSRKPPFYPRNRRKRRFPSSPFFGDGQKKYFFVIKKNKASHRIWWSYL